MLKLFTQNTLLNLPGIFLAAIFVLYFQNPHASVLILLLTLIIFIGILFFAYLFGKSINLKPGEDYLVPYILVFLSVFSLQKHSILISSILLIIGLFYLIYAVNNLPKIKPTTFYQITLIFAVSSLFYKPYVFFVIFLTLISLILFKQFRYILIILLAYLTVYYLFFTYKIIFEHWHISQLKDILNFPIKKILFPKKYYIFTAENIILGLFSTVFIFSNYNHLSLQLRKNLMIYLLFLAVGTSINILFTNYPTLPTLTVLAIIYSYFFTKVAINTKIKELIFSSFILIEILIILNVI